jgi:hypothetical protein
MHNIKKLQCSLYNLSTGFPQKMWKSFKSPCFSGMCVVLLSCFILISCSSMKNMTGKSQPAMENSLISMNEDEVRKKLGEPTMVSMMPDKRILWTYRPSWKLMPDNKGTIYLEFDQGVVTKVIKADK